MAVAVLSGLGGMGKTTLALEYAHRHIEEFAVVWQFHAEDDTTMLAQFHDLARILGADDRTDPVAAVHTVLAGHPGRWLLVLDNVTDHAAARPWIPPKGQGQVLVTTRDGHWPARQVLLVSALDRTEGASLLTRATGSTDTDSARAVSAELGGLPLALNQAAAYCLATGRTLSQYLHLLHTDRAAVLARNAPADHDAPVTATWSLAITRLESDSPGALALLRIAAHLAPDDIPFRLLLHPHAPLPTEDPDYGIATQVRALCNSSVALDDAVTALRHYSLIGPPGDTLSIHRLVQTVTRDHLPHKHAQAWRETATALVEAAVPTATDARETWSVCRLLLPHAQLIADPLGMPMWRLAKSLGTSGDYATARAQWHTLAEAHAAVLGDEHPHALAAQANFAYWTGQAGDAATARDMYAALLPVRTKVSGPEHPDTLVAQANLARWTGQAGDAVAARDMYVPLMPIWERAAGREHPDVLTARSNLAYLTGQAGNAAAARDMYAELLPIRENVSGREHPDTLVAQANLAYWAGKLGDAVAARDLYASLLPIWNRVLGPEHPDTLTAHANHAHLTGEAGDAVAARDMYAELLPIRERVLGREHPDTLDSRTSLAYWTGKTGDAVAARDTYAELLPIREKVSGPEHPHTLDARANHARWAEWAESPE